SAAGCPPALDAPAGQGRVEPKPPIALQKDWKTFASRCGRPTDLPVRVRFKVMRRFANRQRVGKWQRRHSASGCYWQFLRRPLKFACRFASAVITVASSEGNLKEAAVIETSRIAKVRSVSASLWIAPPVEH